MNIDDSTNEKKLNEKEIKQENKFNHNYVSVAFLYFCSTAFLIEARKITDAESALFPYIVSIFGLVIATVILLVNLFGKNIEDFDFTGTKRTLKYGILLVIYGGLVKFFGFYLSTFVYLFVGMTLLGQKNLLTKVLISFFTPVIIYVFFEFMLDLRIPKGLWFKLF